MVACASSAQRRRDRKLRVCWGHEQQSVQVAVALRRSRGRSCVAASKEDDVYEPYYAPRGQTTLPPLRELAPQRSDRTVRHSQGDLRPTLALPSLAWSAAEAVDSSALSFLLQWALLEKKEEEEAQFMRDEEVREEAALRQRLLWSCPAASSRS